MNGLVDHFGQPLKSNATETRRKKIQALRAKYDAAATNDDNRRHWDNADNLSPAAAASPAVRKKLRSRARYECLENNSFGKGIISTLANDCVGRGPRLQVRLKDKLISRKIEQEFSAWARRIGLARKLRMMRSSKAVDGEAFAVSATNSKLRSPVKLDVKLSEGDEFTTPNLVPTKNRIDGIDFDHEGNPELYHRLRQHPGTDAIVGGLFSQTDQIPASQVIHYFHEARPGQKRGFPEVTPALPLFSLVRRFTLAVMGAAETAADFAAVMYSDSPAVDPDDVEPMDSIELEMRAMLTLPQGWKLGQIKAEQPATTYEMFRNAIINEIARCVNMPLNKALGNSKDYNFASGRLDHETYFESITVERGDMEDVVLDRIFDWWLEEAVLVPGLISGNIGLLADIPHCWIWPKPKHIDPQKHANAVTTLWEKGLLSDDQYHQESGTDPDEHHQQMERMVERRKKLGLPLPGEAPRQIQLIKEDDGDG